MPGPSGHVILNLCKNAFPQGVRPHFTEEAQVGARAVALAWLQQTGRKEAEGHQSHTPERSSQPASPTREEAGKQMRLLEPRAWGIQGESGVSCEECLRSAAEDCRLRKASAYPSACSQGVGVKWRGAFLGPRGSPSLGRQSEPFSPQIPKESTAESFFYKAKCWLFFPGRPISRTGPLP